MGSSKEKKRVLESCHALRRQRLEIQLQVRPPHVSNCRPALDSHSHRPSQHQSTNSHAHYYPQHQTSNDRQLVDSTTRTNAVNAVNACSSYITRSSSRPNSNARQFATLRSAACLHSAPARKRHARQRQQAAFELPTTTQSDHLLPLQLLLPTPPASSQLYLIPYPTQHLPRLVHLVPARRPAPSPGALFELAPAPVDSRLSLPYVTAPFLQLSSAPCARAGAAVGAAVAAAVAASTTEISSTT